MRIAIVDDAAAERAGLAAVLRDYATVHSLEISTEEFQSGEDLLAGFHPFAFSVIFLDIYMDGMTGIETAKMIREQDDDMAIIFMTTSEEHRPDAFSVFATDYLIKPCSREAVFRTLDHLLHLRTEQEKRLSFTADRRDYNLPLSDIVSVEADGNYLCITDRNERTYRTRMTFRDAEDRLDDRFIRIIKGVAVNMDHVVQMNEKICLTDTGSRLPMHSRNGKEVRQQWLNYKFTRIRRG